MGEDKTVNEELIKYGWPNDVWFHVDKMSSAHVYLRLPEFMTWTDIPDDVVRECALLVKANSIEGSKLASVSVKYTPWNNLKKTADMDVGQIGFHNEKNVRTIDVKKDAILLKKLNRTKEQRTPDLKAEKEDMERETRAKEKAEMREKRKRDKVETERRKKEEEVRSYKSLMKTEHMKSNEYVGEVDLNALDDDFM